MSELTDKELKNLKPRAKLYKVTDRDGMYAAVTPTGVVSFRYQYRVNGRQEVLTIGRYSAGIPSTGAVGTGSPFLDHPAPYQHRYQQSGSAGVTCSDTG